MTRQQESAQKNPAGQDIPDKLYFRIGEVSKLCQVPAYVLRFWESEFPQLKPNKGGTGQRLYRRRDVEMALRVKSLLYDQGYTIPGARQVFKAEQKLKEPQLTLIPDADTPKATAAKLTRLRRELADLHATLSSPPKRASNSRPALRTLPGSPAR